MRNTILLALVLSLLQRAVAARARAQCPEELRDVPTHVLLARTCVSERGWRAETDDCAAIYEVVAEHARAHGMSTRSAICDLSPRLHGADVELDRPWLRDLHEDGRRPRGLRVAWERPRCRGARVRGECPEELAETPRREVWLATVAEAAALLAGGVEPVCASPPRAWGSDADLRRRREQGFGWREVECGETANHFGSVLARR